MKKILSFLMIMVFLISISKICFAQLEEKKAELEKISKYINLLDQKINKARAAKQINKLAELKELKRRELARAEKLKAEIARLEKGKKIIRARVERRGGFQVKAGYGGGAAVIGVGYRIPIASLELLVDAGYGIGNEYSIVNLGLAGIFPFGKNYAGLELGMSNYSETVTNIFGVSGNIEKGSKTGFGVFAGRKIGVFNAQIGYNTALGLTAGAVYKF